MELDFSQPDEGEHNLAPGDANFKVMRAKEKQSKSGNPMVVAELWVQDTFGNKGKLTEYFTITEKARWKIKQFLMAVGDFQSVKRNISAQDFIDKRGKCILELKPSESKRFPDGMIAISEYIQDPQYANLVANGTNTNVNAPAPAPATPEAPPVFTDDDIPFDL